MTKTINVTYTAVSSACAEILKLGEKPSIRNIHARTGGSYSTLATFFRQWKQAVRETEASTLALSGNLKNALAVEVVNITKSIKQQFESQIASDHKQAQEASELLAEYEEQLVDLKQQITKEQELIQAQRIDYEAKLAVLSEQVAVAQREKETFQQHMMGLSKDYQQCQVELAVYQERCSGLHDCVKTAATNVTD